VSEWREVTLGDVVELKRGYDLPASKRRAGPVPIVSSSGRTGWHDEAKVMGPGVVTGRYGTLGEVFYIEEDFWPLNTALYVRDFKGNHPRFVAALLSSLDLGRREGAAAVPGVNRNHLHALPVSVPDIRTQARIAQILAAMDNLIENSRRRIALLEKLAQAIYREWFVKFRYPGNEDHELVDSPLGPIPAGWEVTTLAEQSASLVDGDWIESKDQGGGDYRLLQVSNIGVGSFRETGNFRYITAQTFERLRCTEIRVGDILISRMPDPIGRAWLVDVLDSPAVTAVDVAILTPRSPESGVFLSHWLNTPETLARADAVATGTTRKRITRSVLGGLAFAMPPPQHISHFFKTVAPMAEAASTLRRKSASLATMRDLLLPKLVTGAIDVSKLDLDALLEESAA
jgi:type I restriction enzyme, S subunit